MTLSYNKNGWDIIPAQIYDAMGNLLKPGTIIAYPAGTKLKFGVYEGLVKTVGWHGDSQYRMYICIWAKNKVRRSMVGNIKYNSDSKEFEPAEEFVAIKNPLYHLDNPKLAPLIVAIDKLKDEGILNKNFKLS